MGFKDYCDVDRGWVFLLSQVGSENECKYLSNLYVFDIYEKRLNWLASDSNLYLYLMKGGLNNEKINEEKS